MKILTVGNSVNDAIQMAEAIAEDLGEEVVDIKRMDGIFKTDKSIFACMSTHRIHNGYLRGRRFDKAYVLPDLPVSKYNEIKQQLNGIEIEIFIES